MNPINRDDIRRISNQLDAFYTAFRSGIYYEEVCNSVVIQQSGSEFWKFQKYLLLYSLVVNWCEVFGPHTVNNHWKEITFENRGFTSMLYERTSFDYTGWSNYRKEVDEIKKTFMTDPDLYHHDSAEIDLYGIEASLNITHQWLYDLVQENKENLPEEVINRWPIRNRTFSQDVRHEFRNLFNQEGEANITQAV